MDLISSIQVTKGEVSLFSDIMIFRKVNTLIMSVHKKGRQPSSKYLEAAYRGEKPLRKEGVFQIYLVSDHIRACDISAINDAILILKENNRHWHLSHLPFIQGFVLAKTGFNILESTCIGY